MGGLCCKVIYFMSPNAIESLTEPMKLDLRIDTQFNNYFFIVYE